MIGLDTNVVVRLLVEDDPSQARRAQSLLDQAAEAREPVFLSDIVLSELEWVLESAYSVPRRRIVQAVQQLLADERFAFENRKRLSRALALYEGGSGDLSDYLIGLRAGEEGARTTYTFDRDLRDDERFTLL